jgi:site-specific recombinase XerD
MAGKQAISEIFEQAVNDYLQWMASSGYAPGTCNCHQNELIRFLDFVKHRRLEWNETFTLKILDAFKKDKPSSAGFAVKGLSSYLFRQNRVGRPIEQIKYLLPEIYEQYLLYHQRSQGVPYRRIKQIKRVLAAMNDYLKRHKIHLSALKIDQIDAFLAEFFTPFSPGTRKAYRSVIRKFLNYLYFERRIIKRNLAALVIGPPMFARAKPPSYLRPQEIKKLFDSARLSSPLDIRTYAMLHLAYTLGLRPDEICSITLDDISLSRGEISVEDRKTDAPVILPIPEKTVKAIAAYLVGVRPHTHHRTLFISLKAPLRPISATAISNHIKALMRKANLSSSAYWLRHTYAQNLLEAGASIYEIKEMLGHDSIESTRQYLHVHIKLMRKVLFDEEL